MQKSYDGNACLYLVPTPIGNMDDITARSLEILRKVDVIFCEDTRTSSVLLKHYDINKKLISCHMFNEDTVKDKVREFLDDNKSVALISDQGSPVISDPGYVVSSYLINLGYNVVALPGATAFTPALMMSGLSTEHFLYYGFLNSKNSKRQEELENLKNYPFTMIFYEAPHRILDTLSSMEKIFGDREVAVVREISKIHEEVVRDKLSNIGNLITVKGEFVIVVGGYKNKENFDDISIENHVKLYMNDGMKKMDAIKKVAKERGVAKSEIYKEFIDKE